MYESLKYETKKTLHPVFFGILEPLAHEVNRLKEERASGLVEDVLALFTTDQTEAVFHEAQVLRQVGHGDVEAIGDFADTHLAILEDKEDANAFGIGEHGTQVRLYFTERPVVEQCLEIVHRSVYLNISEHLQVLFSSDFIRGRRKWSDPFSGFRPTRLR